jgi:hypothetical protein
LEAKIARIQGIKKRKRTDLKGFKEINDLKIFKLLKNLKALTILNFK